MLAALMAMACGCKTVTDAAGVKSQVVDTNAVDRTASVLKATVSGGALLAVEKDKNAAAYFQIAAAVIDKIVVGGDTTPATIQKSVAAIPSSGLQRPEARLALTAGLGLYEVYWGEYVRGKVGGNYAAVTLLTAVRDGIYNALPQQQNMRGVYIERMAKLRGAKCDFF